MKHWKLFLLIFGALVTTGLLSACAGTQTQQHLASHESPATDHDTMGQGGMDHGMMGQGGMDHGMMGQGGKDHGMMGQGGMGHGMMGQGGKDHGMMGQGGMGHGMMGQGGMDHGMDHAMDLGPADDTYDLRFIDGMIVHHQGAVEMAEEALAKSQRREILALAEAIIAAQADEIDLMNRWRSSWYPEAGSDPVMYDPATGTSVPMSAEYIAMMKMSGDLGAADNEFDLRFIEAMVPHHEGAVDMARDALEKSQRSELRALAEEIIATQQEEIDLMMSWKDRWYNGAGHEGHH